MIRTELDIKGIGEKTQEALIKKFKSVKRIKELSFEELAAEIGQNKARIIVDYFNNNKNE